MKKQLFLILSFTFLLYAFIGCSDNSVVDPEEELTEEQALLKLADEDEVLLSFELNYNEEDALGFFGKTVTEIYPVRVGQRMRLVNRNMNITFQGDSAIGKLTKTFEGILFIAASYEPQNAGDTLGIDTLLQKPFTTTVTRNIIFTKVNNTRFPSRNWIITAISLPEGGTLTENIALTKVTVFLPDGDSLIVDSPNDYYLSRGPGFRRQIPVLSRNEPVTVRVELRSLYEDEDFVTLTYGAVRGNLTRAKKRFQLVSSEFDGQYYHKVYEQVWTARQFPGYKHAIINALPEQVIFDDSTPVEENSWGIPYYVRP